MLRKGDRVISGELYGQIIEIKKNMAIIKVEGNNIKKWVERDNLIKERMKTKHQDSRHKEMVELVKYINM